MEIEQVEAKRRRKLGETIENTGWALFLIMIGLLWMLPEYLFPEGSWLIGSGLIILGVQLFRFFFGLRASGGTLVLGVLALGLGFGDMIGFEIPVFPAILVLVGLYMLFDLLFRKRGGD